jgi:hypothetical protein
MAWITSFVAVDGAAVRFTQMSIVFDIVGQYMVLIGGWSWETERC